MRRLIVALALAASLAGAGVAQAGGWATVQLSSLPTGLGPGEPWEGEVTVLQHGRTPLAGVTPTLTIRSEKTGKELVFAARPTDRVGVYAFRVVFPAAGSWSYEVFDDFTQYGGAQTHTFAPVAIGKPVPSSAAPVGAPSAVSPVIAEGTPSVGGHESGGAFPVWLLAGGAALALVIVVLALLLRRSRLRVPAPTH